MSERPYFQYSAQELESLALENWGSFEKLDLLCKELSHRTTPKAQNLERRVTARITELRPAPHAHGNSEFNGELRQLRDRLLVTEQLLRQREQELATARRQADELRRGSGGSANSDYEEVGLDPDCPDFMVVAAKRVWLNEHHPDRLSDRPVAEQRAAEETFKRVQNVFERIFKQRAR